jgi:hypothetical protein
VRCDCCNKILKPSESTRKFKLSGAYTNTCNECLAEIADDSDEFTKTVEGAGVDEGDDESEFED